MGLLTGDGGCWIGELPGAHQHSVVLRDIATIVACAQGEQLKPETVKQLVKHVGEGVMGAAKSLTGGDQAPETMDSVSSRIITYSDSDDEGEKLKPRPAPQLPPERKPRVKRQPPEHHNVLGESLWGLHKAA